MPTNTALVLDEDQETQELIVERLKSEGISALTCQRADMVKDTVVQKGVDICFIGSRAWGMDGLEIVRELRQDTSSGIMVLGHSNDEVDVVLALEMGADDYLSKPVRPKEMCARARSVMRRVLSVRTELRTPRPLPEHYLLQLGDLEICAIARSVSLAGQPVNLTALEFDVLCALAAQSNSVLSRDRIIESVRGSDWSVNHRSVDGIVSRLRRKLFSDDDGSLRIKTVHGRGYMLVV
ncbi:DNA-binding response regulator [Roseovarius sp. TE539]|uniref:response regulator transcription factor n=1 Tax=Roseovarius sp. TE539 TaxID=2249812 RepID=UPI000DE046FE|nr:response regulator transcription factor [Roseovarius sp. TE539]RBI71179.1 DNA-binding response regulator [Roseovarius sp. TE539]